MTAPLLLAALLPIVAPQAGPAEDRAKVVFVTGDEEYRGEESMPMLAAILQRDHAVDPVVLFSQTDGRIDQDRLDDIPGLEALDDADLLVLFTRFRALPPDQMRHVLNYVESGRPVVGFRTGTHAFKYPDDSRFAAWNEEKIAELVGQRWIVHHGHFADGENFLTEVTGAGAESPILRGVDAPFRAYSWLYHVEGGGDSLAAGSEPLLTGRSLRSKRLPDGEADRYAPVQPVAWTKTNPFSPAGAEPGRVFFTTLGTRSTSNGSRSAGWRCRGSYGRWGGRRRSPPAAWGSPSTAPTTPPTAGSGPASGGWRPPRCWRTRASNNPHGRRDRSGSPRPAGRPGGVGMPWRFG